MGLQKRVLGPFVTVLVVAAAVVVLCIGIMPWFRGNGYPIAVDEFLRQATSIRLGMTSDEVQACVKSFSHMKWEGSRKAVYSLEPTSRWEGLAFRPTQFIVVEFDANGKVSKVLTGDG